MKPLTVQRSPVPHYFPPLLPLHSTLFSYALNLCSSLKVKVQVYISVTITTIICTCININADVACVFYMILRHDEGA